MCPLEVLAEGGKTEPGLSEPEKKPAKKPPPGKIREPIKMIAKKTAKELSVAEELAAMATRHSPEQAQMITGLKELIQKYVYSFQFVLWFELAVLQCHCLL